MVLLYFTKEDAEVSTVEVPVSVVRGLDPTLFTDPEDESNGLNPEVLIVE